jgi:hypothetical protein
LRAANENFNVGRRRLLTHCRGPAVKNRAPIGCQFRAPPRFLLYAPRSCPGTSRAHSISRKGAPPVRVRRLPGSGTSKCRAAASTPNGSRAAQLRVWRVPGVTIWLVRSDRSEAPRAEHRSVRQAGSFTRSVKEDGPRSPGTGTSRVDLRRRMRA